MVTPAGVVGRVVKDDVCHVGRLAHDGSQQCHCRIDPSGLEMKGSSKEPETVGPMKYIPLLSTVHPGDRVITSGLTGVSSRVGDRCHDAY